MNPRQPCSIRSVLILKTDLLVAEAIQHVVETLWPEAQARVARRVKAARTALRVAPVDLLLTGLGLFDGDVCSLLKAASQAPRTARRIVIVTDRRDPRFLSLLHDLPVDGAYHTQSDGLHHLPRALRAAARGRRYFSRKFVDLMREPERSDARSIHLLTDAEIHALAVFGSGCDAKEAASRLKVKLRTAHSLADALHRKLNVHSRGALMRVALEAEVIRCTAGVLQCLDERELARRHWAARRKRAA